MEAMVAVLVFLDLTLLVFFLCIVFLPAQAPASSMKDQSRRIRDRDEVVIRMSSIITTASLPAAFVITCLSATEDFGVAEYGSAESFAVRLPFFIPEGSASIRQV